MKLFLSVVAILVAGAFVEARGSRQNAPRVETTTGVVTDTSAYGPTGTNADDTTMTPNSGTGMRDDQIIGDRTHMPTGRVKARDIEKRNQDNTARDRTNSSGSEGTGAGTGAGPISE